jgi:hypothetical protein
MAQPAGEADALRLDFDCRLKLEFHGSSETFGNNKPGGRRGPPATAMCARSCGCLTGGSGTLRG